MASLPDLSVQLYSIREALAEDFAGSLGRLADIGLTRVEPYDLVSYLHPLRTALPAAGLSAPTAHQSMVGSDLNAVFAAAAELGVDMVIHPYTPAERWQNRSQISALAELMNEAAGAAAPFGVRVAYHNHDWELSTHIDGRAALEHFADLLDPAVRLQVDAYWAATGGANVPALVERLEDRVVALHLKDGPLNGNTAAQLPLGSGDLPAKEIIEAAHWLEFPVLEFDDYAGDRFDGIAASYTYARETLGAVR